MCLPVLSAWGCRRNYHIRCVLKFYFLRWGWDLGKSGNVRGGSQTSHRLTGDQAIFFFFWSQVSHRPGNQFFVQKQFLECVFFIIPGRITDLNIFLRSSDLKNFHGFRTKPFPISIRFCKSILWSSQQHTTLSFDKHFSVMILTELQCQDDVCLKLLARGGSWLMNWMNNGVEKKMNIRAWFSRLFTVPYFFVRSFRYTASYHHGYLGFQMYRGGGRRGL